MVKQAQRVAPVTTTQAPTVKSGPRVSRRSLLIGAGAAGIGAYALTDGTLTGRIGTLIDDWLHPVPLQVAIAHLLRRAGFGGSAAEHQAYVQLGMNGAIDRLVNYNQVPDDFAQQTKGMSFNLNVLDDTQRWWLMRMILTKRPLQEKMTLFWHGLLTSNYSKSGTFFNIVQQNQFLRDHALDTYDNLLLGITHDAAMMWWLDLRLSFKNAPNENYARELMELFSLGVRGGYTQKDVHEAARALTGWVIKDAFSQPYYDASNHDDGAKTLLGHTGHFDYRDVIRIVAAHPATGPYLCKRLFSFFVGEDPSDADVQPMVDAYYQHGHSMRAVVQAMFTSPAFFAPQSLRSRLKSPAEFVTGALRQLEVTADDHALSGVMSIMGQRLLDPPNVAGWVGDQRSAAWLNSGTWLARINHINGTLAGMDDHLQTLIQQYQLTTPQAVVKHFSMLLIDDQLTDDQRTALTDYLTSTAEGRTIALAGGGQTVPASGVRGMLYLLMTSPAYLLN